MAVLPEARGHRIGWRLLEQIEHFAREEDLSRLYLSTTPFLDRAISLYEHYGFHRTEEGPYLVVGSRRLRVFSERDPARLPWGGLGCDVVIESTGVFRSREQAARHLAGGAKKVVISAPATDEVDRTVVLGVNDERLTGEEAVLSNASCTTHCLAPLVKILDDGLGAERGFMTAVNAYTANQNLHDAPHRDLRRARAAALSVIPTTSSAVRAVGLVLPHLRGRLDGLALRVPVPAGSLTDLTVVVRRETSVEEVNALFRAAASGDFEGLVQYTEAPLVSTDIIHNPHSAIFDAPSTMVDGRLVKVVGWYDNEWGYANRLVELAARLREGGRAKREGGRTLKRPVSAPAGPSLLSPAR